MADLPFPKSLPEFQKLFPDDAACATYLERIHWREQFTCACGWTGESYRFKAKPWVLRCRSCQIIEFGRARVYGLERPR